MKLVFDISNLAWRSYHAGTPGGTVRFKNAEGQNSAHIFLSAKIIISTISKWGPFESVVFACDALNARRQKQKLYCKYKANRAATEFDPIPDVWSFVCDLPCQIAYSDGKEADDVIATLVTRDPNNYIIISNDHDLWQLLDRARIIKDGRNITEADVLEKYELPIEKLVLWKAVFGDKSDNIPRVPRVRVKYIIPALQQVDSLFELYAGIRSGRFIMPEFDKKLMLAHESQTYINYALCLLDVDVSTYIQSQPGDVNAVEKCLRYWGCDSMIESIHRTFFKGIMVNDARCIGKDHFLKVQR